MKDIKAILAGITLTDEQREEIIKEVGENYRSIVEVTKKAQRIEELENQNKALTEQVSNLEGDGEELEKLRKQISDFEEAEKKREADELEAAQRKSFEVLFNAALGDKEFANDIVRDTVFEKAFKKCHETVGFKPEDAIEELTKDTDGIWKNPQKAVEKMPGQDDLSNSKDHEAKDDARAIADFMFRKR